MHLDHGREAHKHHLPALVGTTLDNEGSQGGGGDGGGGGGAVLGEGADGVVGVGPHPFNGTCA